jgi:hypothetical protein
MGVRAGASLYDSVTGITLGPIFETVNEADLFLDWYTVKFIDTDDGPDLRELSHKQVAELVEQWTEETGGV